MRNIIGALLLVAASALPAAAQPKVLICYGDSQAVATTLQMSLMATNAFKAVDIFSCQTGTPTLVQLKMYEAVVLWDNQMYLSRAALGDVMSDYVDAGGGVVQAMFNLYTNYNLLGKWAYSCINPGNSQAGTLKPAANEPNSPLVKDVKVMTTQNSSAGTLNQALGAVSVWDYTNNAPAIARCVAKGRPRVDVNFYPNGQGNVTGDWIPVLRNALGFVAGGFSSLKATPQSLMFPDTGTGGQSNPQMVMLTNGGMAQINVTGFTIGGTHATDFVVTNAPQPPLALAVGASVNVSVAFKPTAGGARSGTLQVAIAGQMGTTDVALSGTGVGAKLQITPNPINAGGTQLGKSTKPVPVMVSNAGGGKVTIKGVIPSGPNAAEFTFSGLPNFPVALGAGASFSFTTIFTCAAQGTRTAQLTVTSDDPNTPMIVIPVKGTCGDPMISLDVGTMAFGNQRVGVPSAAQFVTVSNSGLSDMTVTGLTMDGANVGDFTLAKMNLPGPVPAGGSEKFSVTFKPTALGQRQARVVLMSSDPQSPTKFVGLLGTGTTSTIGGMPAAIDFGPQKIYAASTAKTFTVTNTGGDAANVTMITFSGKNAAYFALSNAPALPAKVPAMNGALNINVVAQPLALGPADGVLNVITDDPMKPMFAIPLKVEGVGATVKVTPNFIDFGAVTLKQSSKPVTIKIDNTGTDTLTIMDMILEDEMAGVFTIAKLPMVPAMIPKGGSLSFDVSFKTDVAMTYAATISLITDDPMAKLVKIPLSGFGAMAGAGLQVTPLALDFGVQPLAMPTAPKQITLSNSGDIPINMVMVTLGGGSPGSFQIDQQGPFTVDGKKSQIINVSFTALAGGQVSAELSFASADGPVPMKVRLSGAGVTPKLGVAPGDLDFGSIAVGTTSLPQTVSLQNGGGVPIKLMTIASSDPSFIVDSSMTNLNLMPMQTTSFTVAFMPNASGMKAGIIGVTPQGSNMPLLSVKVAGVGAIVRRPPSGCAVAARGAPPSAPLLLLGALSLLGLALRSRRRPQ